MAARIGYSLNEQIGDVISSFSIRKTHARQFSVRINSFEPLIDDPILVFCDHIGHSLTLGCCRAAGLTGLPILNLFCHVITISPSITVFPAEGRARRLRSSGNGLNASILGMGKGRGSAGKRDGLECHGSENSRPNGEGGRS